MTTFLKFIYLFAMMCMMLTFVYAIITALLLYREFEDRLYLCNVAAYQAVDIGVMKQENRLTFTDTSGAERMFRMAIQNTFHLDGSLAPTTESGGSLVGPIRIVQFQLKNENTPAVVGGETLNRNPAVYSEVEIPYQIPGMLGRTFVSRVRTITVLPTSE